MREVLGRWLGVVSRPALQLVACVLAIKVLVFLYGALAYQALANERIVSLDAFLALWNRWDAPHYIEIAQRGYLETAEGQVLLVFLPLFPFLVRLGSYLVGNFVLSGIAVSTVASLALALLMDRLVRLDDSEDIARRAVWFLFIFPSAFFLHIGYTESLFLALVVGSFLAARRRKWMMAGMLAGLASFARMNGLLMVPALALEAASEYRATKKMSRSWLWIAAVGAFFSIYLAVSYAYTGDPFYYVTIQKKFYTLKTVAWPWEGIRVAVGSYAWRAPSEAQMLVFQELLFVALGLVGTAVAFFTLWPSYSLWMLANWLFFTSSTYLISVTRYTLCLFPLFLLFARLARRPFWFAMLTVWSLLFQALFISLFVQTYWVA